MKKLSISPPVDETLGVAAAQARRNRYYGQEQGESERHAAKIAVRALVSLHKPNFIHFDRDANIVGIFLKRGIYFDQTFERFPKHQIPDNHRRGRWDNRMVFLIHKNQVTHVSTAHASL